MSSSGIARGQVVDGVLGVLVGVAALAGAHVGTLGGSRPLDVGAVAVCLAVGAAVALRNRYPVAALVVLDAAPLVWFAAGYPGGLILLGPLLGCFALAARRGWRWGLAGAAVTVPLQIVGIRVVLGDTETAAVVPLWALLVATAVSAGTAVGYHRAVLAATHARLTQEARLREERAAALVVEERLRIAQELHDIVGHTMATVSVQAGVALHVVDRRPEQARQALTAIKTLCDDGLDDVKATLGILRADREPRGRLAHLDDLVAATEGGGVRVELTVDGEPRPLPTPVDLAAYRIVQESLTNVLRHAGARTVWLTLTHEPSRLLIHVRDDGTARPGGDHTGHGIDGMRERARAFAGRFSAAARPEGGFEVRAELPVPGRAPVKQP